MPSIEISLSSDSQCIGSSRSQVDDARSTVALYDEQAVMHGSLAEFHSSPSHNGDYTNYNGYHFYDIIEVHDEMEDSTSDSDSENEVFRNEEPFHQKPSNKKSSSKGVVGGFASMIQYNFASRATMSPMAPMNHRHLQIEAKRRSPYHGH